MIYCFNEPMFSRLLRISDLQYVGKGYSGGGGGGGGEFWHLAVSFFDGFFVLLCGDNLTSHHVPNFQFCGRERLFWRKGL